LFHILFCTFKYKGWLFENVIPRGFLDNIFFKHLLAARSRALKKLAKQQENKKD
jgi:hypothetical protein